MKKIIYFLLIASLLSCSNKTEYVVQGIIDGYTGDVVYLNKVEEGKLVVADSTIATKGKFKFKGAVSAPEMCYLTIKGTNDEFPFFLENSRIFIDASFNNFKEGKISGSSSNDELTYFSKMEEPFQKELDSIYYKYMAAQDAGNNELMEFLDKSYEEAENEKLAFIKDYIHKNNSSFVSPYLVTRKLSYSIELNELDPIINHFDASLDNSIYLQQLKTRSQILKQVEIGQPFVDVEQNDSSGTPIALSSFKGKYVLIDFWASWCPPCRAENPNVVALYKIYKNKGFEVYAISLDNSREKWINGIKEDNITYTQVSELKGWQNSAAKIYGVNSIPHTVLLDKEGIIIAKNIRGEDLKAKLAELMD